MNTINYYIKNIIFSYIPITKTISLTSYSKKYIELLNLKKKKNVCNFCQLYINRNKCPTLKSIYIRYSNILSNSEILDIFLYYLNKYESKTNKTKTISFYYDLDIELSKLFLKIRNYIKNPINLIILKKETLFEQNLNFQNLENVHKFCLFDKFKNRVNSIRHNEENLFRYYLALKYAEHLIPYSVSFISIIYSCENFLNTFDLYKKENEQNIKNIIDINYIEHNIGNKKLIKKYLLELIFNELTKYDNIKEFEFVIGDSGEIDTFYIINDLLKENNKFLSYLNKIILNVFYNNNLIDIFNELKKYKKIEFIFNNEVDFGIYKTHMDKFQLNGTHDIKVYDLDDMLEYKNFFSKIESLRLEIPWKEYYQKIKNFDDLNNVLSLISFNNLNKLYINKIETSNASFLDEMIRNLNNNCQNLKYFEIYHFITHTRQIIKNKLCLKHLETLYIDSNDIYYGEQIFKNKICNFSIDELISIKKICFPFDFEVNNDTVLNQIESIEVRFIQNGHEKFLEKILKGKSLKKFIINFRAPIKNKKLIEILFNNLKNIEFIHISISHILYYGKPIYELNEDSSKTIKECHTNTITKSEKFYFNTFNNILKNNSLEKLLPNVKYMELYPNCNYHQNYEEMSEEENLIYLKKYPFLRQVCVEYFTQYGIDLNLMLLNSKIKNNKNENKIYNNSELINNLFDKIY